jgi:molecular chaperone GrpE
MAKKTVNSKQETVSSNADKVHVELESMKGMLARALADYENLRRRTDEEKVSWAKFSSLGIVSKLLPVLDMFENAQKHLKDQGLAIGIGEFVNVLKDEGLVVINPSVGTEFNEQEMEAIEVVNGTSDNTISEVVIPGWKFKDGVVVRHAKVKVFKVKEEEKSS